MTAPGVSHRSWKRAEALCMFVMEGKEKQVQKMGFSNKLKAIFSKVESFDKRLTVQIREMKNEDDNYYHAELSTPGRPYRYTIYPNEQQRDHRPSVSADIEDRLTQAVNREYPNVPAETLSFDDRLELLFDKFEEYYKHLNCYVREREKEAKA